MNCFSLPMRAIPSLYLICLMSFPGSVFADDASGQRGRLPDGRAYRLDGQGMRLIDQMAELEVTVDDLKRQVIALENELEEKNRQLERVSGGKALGKTSVEETNLTSPPRSKVTANLKEPPDCNELVSSLYLKVSQLESQLKATASLAQSPQVSPVLNSKDCDYDSPENPLWGQVTRLQTELMKNPSPEQLLREKQRSEELETKLADLSQRLEEVEKEKSAIEKSKSQSLAKMSPEVSKNTVGEKKSSKQLESEPSKASTSEIASAKKEFAQSIKVVQDKILKRKDLFDSLAKRGSSVRVQLQPLAAKNGTSLDALRRQIASLQTEQQIEQTRKALKEIDSLLDDDIAVLSRLL